METGIAQRFVSLTLDQPGDADAPGLSAVLRRGEPVGLVTSGGWSFTLETSIALAFLRADLAVPGTAVEIEVLGRTVAATVGREPLFDPDNARLRT